MTLPSSLDAEIDTLIACLENENRDLKIGDQIKFAQHLRKRTDAVVEIERLLSIGGSLHNVSKCKLELLSRLQEVNAALLSGALAGIAAAREMLSGKGAVAAYRADGSPVHLRPIGTGKQF